MGCKILFRKKRNMCSIEDFLTGGPGPHVWDDDLEKYPEGKKYSFESYTYTCFIKRSDVTAAWCCYIDLPSDHPYNGSQQIVVYCGKPSQSLYDGVNTVNFNCMNYQDIWPFGCAPYGFDGIPRTYKDYEFAKAETENLAKQLKSLE
jgi:hypothetical protein